MTKHELRSVLLARRKNLSREEVEKSSERICGNLFEQFDFSRTNCLHTFLPIVDNHEPDTWRIIRNIRKRFPLVSIVIPKVVAGGGEMKHFIYREDEELSLSKWGIPEPQETTPVAPHVIDVILVPLLTFDRNGHRVGYGRGFYDRFLRQCRPDAWRIGLSLFEGVDQITDVNEYDERLHYCVTPNEVISFIPPAPVD